MKFFKSRFIVFSEYGEILAIQNFISPLFFGDSSYIYIWLLEVVLELTDVL